MPRMAEFQANPTRIDPYKNFNFCVKWIGKFVAAISRVTGLLRTTEGMEHREGCDPSTSRKSTGLTQFAPITLERGLTDDPAFEDWANLVWKLGAGFGSESSLNEFRKDISIELYNEAGQLVRAYIVHRCWPSEFEALSDLDANNCAVVIEKITLQNEGWARDTSVTVPVQA
jgi:phage tail-like protein